MQRLIEIQQKLKAPKNQKNTFGNYMYRSAEDILESVKPLLKEQNVALVIQDEVINISDRFYVKATATLYGENGKEIIKTSALAREDENKKGQDGSQLTGATSSYARKYALNGLFAIDDNKDSDCTNKHNKDLTQNNDIDIIEGLKACDNIKNLNAYYKEYESKVTDLKKFQSVYSKTAHILKQKED